MNKKILIAAFIDKNDSGGFLIHIKKLFNVHPSKVFQFEIKDDMSQNLFTFYIELEIGEKINLRKYFKNALIVHKKKSTFYTINALNKLIEEEFKLEGGNIVYKDFNIDWDKFKNKLILKNNNNLSIIDLKQVFS